MGEMGKTGMTDKRKGKAWVPRWWRRRPCRGTSVLDRWSREALRRSLTLMPGLLVLVLGTSMAQPPVSRLTLEEAVMLATRENTTIRAKAFERQATAAQEITMALRPNPTASFSAEQLASRPVEPQYTVAVEQTIETGGKRQRRIAAARAATRVVDFEVDDTRRRSLRRSKRPSPTLSWRKRCSHWPTRTSRPSMRSSGSSVCGRRRATSRNSNSRGCRCRASLTS
jgi:hypothetical protein